MTFRTTFKHFVHNFALECSCTTTLNIKHDVWQRAEKKKHVDTSMS